MHGFTRKNVEINKLRFWSTTCADKIVTLLCAHFHVDDTAWLCSCHVHVNNDYTTTTTERYVRAAAVAYYCLFTFMLITYYRDKQLSTKRRYFVVKIITFCSCKMHGRRSIIVCMHGNQCKQGCFCFSLRAGKHGHMTVLVPVICMHPLFNQVEIYLLDSILLGTWISCVSR